MRKILVAIILLCCVSACTVGSKETANTTEKNVVDEKNKQIKRNETTSIKKIDNDDLRATKKPENNRDECLNVNVGDRMILKSQTFQFDFEPFKGACFVSTHDLDFADPPRALELALYKDGRKIYTFDSRFNPESINCSVNAISFKDLNKDNLQDIIVTGTCAAKSGELLANEVFINTGKKTFVTNVTANDKLDDLKNVEEVTEFVKKNEKIFFK